MKSYLSMIPMSAKVHGRQNRMTVLCIAAAVFLVTAVFSMAEMGIRQETSILVGKHGIEEVKILFASEAFKSLIPIAVVLFLFVLFAGVLMIAGSMNSSVEQRTKLFGMMRCIGMSKRQVTSYVVLEGLNLCRRAVPAGLLAGTAVTWALCAVLKYFVGGEWVDMPQLKLSLFGIVGGVAVGILTVLFAAVRPAKKASGVSPVSALANDAGGNKISRALYTSEKIGIENALGIRHATASKKNLFLMAGSFALSIILFLSFSVFIDLVCCLIPQSASAADIEIYSQDGFIGADILERIKNADGVEIAFGRRAVFDVDAQCADSQSISRVDIISFESFDIDALKKDGMLERKCDLEKVKSGNGALVISDEPVKNGSVFSVFGTQLPAAGKLKYDPFSFDGMTGGKTTLIVSDEKFADMTGTADYTMILIRLSKGASDKEVDAIKAIAGETYQIADERENNTRGTYAAFIACVYGFLGIIALVSIMNIVNSISMSVSARMTQYGTMRAVGMSKKQLARMIRAEALTGASVGCAAGLLLGLILGKWLYGVLVTAHFPYAHWHLPLGELAIVAAFFALAVAAGIAAPIKRLDKMSVTETINHL